MKTLSAALATALTVAACAHAATTTTRNDRTTGVRPAAPRTHRAPAKPRGPASANVPAGAVPDRPAATARSTSGPVRARAAGAARQPLVPQILGASVSPTVVGSGTVVSAVVRTTPGVVSVTAFAAGTSIPVPRVGTGVFAGSTTLPQLPPFARGSYPVTFVARDARGASTQSAVSVSVR